MDEAPVYYSPSGRFPAWGLGLLGAIALVAGLVVGWLYGLAAWYNPFIYINFVLLIAAVMGLGMAVGIGVDMGHIRNPWVASAAGMLAGAVALYVAWAVYGNALLGSGGEEGMPSAFHPVVLLGIVLTALENGLWSIRTFTPTGVVLAGIWLVEAAALVLGPAVLVFEAAQQPYCEDSGAWFESVYKELAIGDAEDALVRQVAEQGRIHELASMPEPQGDTWVSASLKAVGGARPRGALSLHRHTRTVDAKGNESVDSTPIVQALLLDGPALLAARSLTDPTAQGEAPQQG